MKNILIPTDFSSASEAAYRFGIQLAEKVSGKIILLHIIDRTIAYEVTGIGSEDSSMKLMMQEEKQVRAQYEHLKSLYPTKVPVIFFTVVDDVINGVADVAEEFQADLIVMSTHGASGIEEFITGSKAEKIARETNIPILAISKQTSFINFQNIVFPNMLSPGQEMLVRKVKELQETFQAVLHVLLINTPEHFHSDAESKRRLKEFADANRLKNYTLEVRSNEHIRSGIVDYCRETDADMIAIATHGRKGLAHFLKGSIAEAVLNHVDCPVWICRMDENK